MTTRADHYCEFDLNTIHGEYASDGDTSIDAGDFPSRIYNHVLIPGRFSDALEDVLQDAWDSGIGVSFDADALTYTITGLDSGTTYTFGQPFADALGIDTSVSGATSITSSRRPRYVVRPDMGEVCKPSHDFESENQASLAVSDAGRSFGTARTSTVIERSWEIQFEPRAATLDEYATELESWESLVRYARTVRRLIVVTASSGGLPDHGYWGRLVPENATFSESMRGRHWDDYDDYWWIIFRMVVEGRQ